MTHICFVVPHAFALFEPSVGHPFGGSEVQTWLLANGLSQLKDYRVSFIVLDHHQARARWYGKVKVYRHSFYTAYPKKVDIYREQISGIFFKQDGFPYIAIKGKTPMTFYKSAVVRLHDYREEKQRRNGLPIYIDRYEIMPDKFSDYLRINADVYITSGVHELSAEVAAFCQKFGKKHILLAASDYDFSEDHRQNNWQVDRYMSFGHVCHYAIVNAAAIVSQTSIQAKLLKDRFGRDSTVITNPMDLQNCVPSEPYPQRQKALWIGKADRVKRPDILIELAKRFPHIQFDMVMNTSDAQIEADIRRQCPPNVTLLGFVPFHQVDHLFARAFVFINTSEFEGFPNTFLQAGKYQVPILSAKVDPDGFITRHACGITAQGHFDRLVDGLHQLYSQREIAAQYGQNAYRYVEQNHNLAEKACQLSEVIRALKPICN